MDPKHVYDRRHLKQVLHKNEMSDFFTGSREWVQAHLEAVLIGAVVLAAAIFGVVFFVRGQQAKGLEASKALNEAQATFQQAASAPPAQAVQAFNQAYAKYQAVATGWDGTPQAQAARLGQANALLAQDKGADAEREYSALDNRHADDPIAALAAFGRARALELQGKPTAAAAYEDAAQAYPNSAVAAQATAAAQRLKGATPTVKKG